MTVTTEKPPRGVHLMAIVRWVILGASAMLAVFAWASWAHSQSTKSETKHVRWHCPMHPQIVRDEPGECPICHMTLEPFEEGPADAGPLPDGTPRGTTPLNLALDRVQASGVRVAVAVSREVTHARRLDAIVEAPEQGAAEVHVRTPGFVESILADQTGVKVHAGQPLFYFYAPAIFEAEQELLTTRRWSDAGDPLSSATHTKLELLGVQSGEIDAIERSHAARRNVVVVAPRTGYVVKKAITLGSYVMPETTLYAIQDLSKVYVVASVYASDRDVAPRTRGTFRSSRAPERAREGTIDLVYPSVSTETRTTRVRMEIENADGALLPGDFGTVELATGSRTLTLVPRDAIVATGTQTYVFIDEGNGRYAPREVATGEEDGDDVAIVSGVSPGERVVSGATFLLDSESRLRAALAPADAGAR